MKKVYDHDTKKYFFESTPRRDLKWWMNRVHVATPDEEVVSQVQELCRSTDERYTAEREDGFTPAIINDSVRYALLIHHKNQELYNSVANGTF